MIKISASLYAADPLRLAQEIDAVAPYVDSFHIDIMDGQFSPEFGLYGRMVEHIQDYTHVLLDVHLMVSHPQAAAARFSEMGVRSIAFHLEGAHAPEEVSNIIRSNGALSFASVRHTSAIDNVWRAADVVDGLLFLTAPAGGGKFDEKAFDRLDARPRGLPTVVDGKITPIHFDRLAELGIDTAVVGGWLFANGGSAERAKELRSMTASLW